MAKGPRSNTKLLNTLTPGAKDAALGTVVALLIDTVNAQVTAINALRADHNTLIAKLNADGGVTDTNYAVSTATAQTALTALDART
jgi:hypothetical protein